VKQLHSVTDAAKLLGISHWTLRAYVKNGKLTPVRIGRRVLLEEGELERFVETAKSVPSVLAVT
jgi:excisionase family DNA binding protein